MTERDEFLKIMFKNVPSMNVIWIDLKNKRRWPSERPLKELTTEEKKQFNLRRQFPNEVILDIEEKYRYEEVERKLKAKNWSYTVWDTGSRGYHISIYFTNLAEHDVELRNRIRKYIINYFQTDEKLAKENQWLALEHTPHMKTGKIKSMIDKVNVIEPNTIDKDTVEYCKKDLELKEQRKIENKKILKDYHKNDPYLNYVLNNTIEAGDRNNVLFKNLAIGLVQAGLTREEIINYAEKIVQNCPGKTMGEFMGWTDKALNGQLVDYNREELVQWSVNHDKPVLYEMYKNENLADLMSVKQLWNEIWNNSITNQPVWKDLCFYNLLGTIIDEKDPDIDLRVHVIFASDSGSGKDEGVLLVRDILERLGYKTKSPSTVTDKTLIGNINQVKIDFNTKYQLSAEEPSKGKNVYKEPIEKGWLENTNWISFSECEFILKPGLYNRNVQVILRQAMDKSRRVDKGVAGYEIKLKTNTSFIMTTYPMNTIINSVLHNGLFQRTLFYNKILTPEEHKQIRKFINKRNFGKIDDKFNKEEYISKFLEKLRNIKQWYQENKSQFIYEEDADILANVLWDKHENEYVNFYPEDKKILDSIVRRSSNNLEKLTKLEAIANMKTFITQNDIRKAFKLAALCTDSIKDLIVKQDKFTKRLYAILQMIEKGSVSKGMIYDELEKTFNLKSPNLRVSVLKSLIDRGFITIFKSGRNEMLTLTEKGRNYLMNEE